MKGMPSAGLVKFSLNVVPFSSSQASPSRNVSGVPRRVEAVRQRDAYQITDQVPVVKIVPDEDIYPETGRLQAISKRVAKVICKLIDIQNPTILSRTAIAHSVDFDQRRGAPPASIHKEVGELSVVGSRRVQVRIDKL